MVKFHEQIILLTRKNLKIRFSHCCASFCELFIPIFITAIIGLLISSAFSGGTNHMYSPIFGTDYINRNDTTDVDVKFKVCNTPRVWSDNSATQYQCERKYNSINSYYLMKAVKAFNVTYLIDKKVEKKGHSQLAENIIASILHQDDGLPTNWTKSSKTEKELEICILHEQKACQWIYAVVIITDVRDDIKRENKFVMEYKIRFKRDVWSNRNFYTDRLFIDFTMDDDYYTRSLMDDIEKLYMSYQLVNDLTNFKDWFSSTHSYGGFALIQTLMDQGILKYVAGRNESETLEPVKISLVRMPFVYATRDLANRFSKILSVLYCLMFSLTIFSIMRVNSEKCSGFKELLRMHGVSAWTQWMGWLFTNFAIYGAWTALLTFLLCFPLMGGPNFIWLMGINCFIYWLILILLVMSITTFSYLISVFFEKVWTAVSIGLVCWILLTVFMTVISSVVHTLRKWTIIGLMLMPTVAFDVAIKVALAGGGTFRTLGIQVNENVPLTMLHCLFMLILDNFIYMTLAIYLDNVLSSKYGVRKPPLYFLRHLRKFVMKLRGGDAKYQSGNDEEDISHTGVEMSSIISGGMDQPFQPDPEHVEAAVVIQNLRKEFRRNKTRAVDGLTAKMFTGEIYALLGFNGAGKTTTINVLTGLTSPTNGIASIFDLDIRKDMEEIRKYIGLCPQHNLLFDEMSVWDQVAFFGKLKGLSKSEDKAREILQQMGMFDKLNNKPGKLSGGQKRRVHLAIALIGDTKLAFLDEPTSGLDPETRRGVWDILIKLRGKTTMILTTHDMEEADLLGDRIGIMSEGKMICSGTGSFLKKYYGVGYNLKMSAADPQCDAEKVYSFVRGYVPSAKMNFEGVHVQPSLQATSRGASPGSISISLPTADLDLNNVADLMEALRQQQAQLQVDNIGLSLSTMDEVFLKVGEEVQAVTVPVPTCDPSSNDVSSSRLFGTRLTLYRYKTLVLKRMMYFCSAPFTMLFLISFFSAILLLALITISYAFNSTTQSDPPRIVSSSSLSSYKSPIIFMHERSLLSKPSLDYTLAYLTRLHSGNAESIQVQEFPKTTSPEEITRSLRKASIDDIFHYRQHYITGASFDSSGYRPINITGYFSAYALHSAPLSLNLITQTLIKKISGVDAKIGVINHPFKSTQPHNHITPERIGHKNMNKLQFTGLRSSSVFITLIIVSLLTGTSALLPAEERLNKGKHLQIMTGTTPFIYWSAMFTWDFLFFTLVNIIITVIYILADYLSGNWVFTNNGAGWIIFLILECHAFGALWFCYLVSWAPCVKTGSDAFLIVNKFAIIVGILWSVIRQILISITHREVTHHLRQGLEEFSDYVAVILYYGSDLSGYIIGLVPMYSLYLSLFKLSNVSLPNSICNWFPKDVLHLACDKSGIISREDEVFIHSCCENCREDCFQPQSYFNVSSVNLFVDGYETHSMIFDLFMMVLSGIVFAGVLFALEFWPAKIQAERHTEETTPPEESNVTSSGSFLTTYGTMLEEDVENETTRVENIVKDDALETANHALISHNLKLDFGKLQAVKGLSFGVNRGECFGLLGVNGAGKTSTFRMITGDIFPTSGNLYAGGLNYYKHRSTYLSSLGYCTQFDGIIGSLTGLQMLKLYGALRGIPSERLQVDATIWLDKFGLLGSANKKCGHYSGGMKRRLSAAIALIGNPKLLLLDEPTTGVDPAFRQQFWNVIKEVRESGQSVLLTSHTMDECEALCTRLGIMVNGQFKCLGNIQHLKCKFGSGYILTLKLKRVGEEEERDHEEKVNLILEKIVQKFNPCQLQTKQIKMVQYQILNKSLWYSDLFRTMEQIRYSDSNHEIIEEYSITESSLEDVFISLARKQIV